MSLADVHLIDIVLTGLLTGGGYLFKRWIDSSNEQLEQHVTDCNSRNHDVKKSLDLLSEKIGKTAENVANLEGTINTAFELGPKPKRRR